MQQVCKIAYYQACDRFVYQNRSVAGIKSGYIGYDHRTVPVQNFHMGINTIMAWELLKVTISSYLAIADLRM